MQKIGIGQSDFRNFRNNDYYLIDKSLFIKDILEDSNSVVLITRPRRFGKTFNMSMLRYYVDQSIENAEDLFKGLKIMEQGEEYTSKLGYYPCIYMTLKEVRGEFKGERFYKYNENGIRLQWVRPGLGCVYFNRWKSCLVRL